MPSNIGWKDYNKLVGMDILVWCPFKNLTGYSEHCKQYECHISPSCPMECRDGVITAKLASVSEIKRKLKEAADDKQAGR